MVDHYPLFEFACSKIIIDKIFISIKADLAISSFMLYSFGISTEASAPGVLSLKLNALLMYRKYFVIYHLPALPEKNDCL